MWVKVKYETLAVLMVIICHLRRIVLFLSMNTFKNDPSDNFSTYTAIKRQRINLSVGEKKREVDCNQQHRPLGSRQADGIFPFLFSMYIVCMNQSGDVYIMSDATAVATRRKIKRFPQAHATHMYRLVKASRTNIFFVGKKASR